MKNFLFTAPAWLSNLLSIVVVTLLAITTIGSDVIALFTDLNCMECIKITEKVLTIAAIVLAIAKALSKSANIVDVPKTGTATNVVVLLLLSAGFCTYHQLISKQFGSDPQYQISSTKF